jgi:hypothetical protein
MRVRGLAFCLFLLVTVDFSTPFLGGAFTFEAESSAEGLRLHRDRAEARSQPALTPQPVPIAPERISGLTPEQSERAAASPSRWVAALPRARVLPEAPSAPSDDH